MTKSYINTKHIIKEGKFFHRKSELLEECLMEDDFVDADSFNRQGMPTRKSRKQDIDYWYPVDGSVARFGAGADGAGLDCFRGADYSDAALGVLRAKFLD